MSLLELVIKMKVAFEIDFDSLIKITNLDKT